MSTHAGSYGWRNFSSWVYFPQVQTMRNARLSYGGLRVLCCIVKGEALNHMV